MMPRWADWVGKNRDLLFVGAVLAILGTIFVPLPPFVLDCLLVASMAVSVLMLLTVVYVKEPVRFSVFPSLLLVTTAYRLALNVATTRQILANANVSGTAAAGQVIQSFGNFVAAAEPVIGFVIFAILVLVNFVVITKGSGRISEVAARFTLDAMPGKQLAIDSDLGQGIITADEAKRRASSTARWTAPRSSCGATRSRASRSRSSTSGRASRSAGSSSGWRPPRRSTRSRS
jgi:flagellar biosynthesis protein FlhA